MQRKLRTIALLATCAWSAQVLAASFDDPANFELCGFNSQDMPLNLATEAAAGKPISKLLDETRPIDDIRPPVLRDAATPSAEMPDILPDKMTRGHCSAFPRSIPTGSQDHRVSHRLNDKPAVTSCRSKTAGDQVLNHRIGTGKAIQ